MEYNLDNIYTYHAPDETDIQNYKFIRESGKIFASLLLDLCPESAECTLALRKIEEAVMWANASIARNR